MKLKMKPEEADWKWFEWLCDEVATYKIEEVLQHNNHWTSFNMAEGYGLICCGVVPEWSDCFRCLHRGIRRVDASSVDTLPMVRLLPVATLWTLRDLTLPSVTISSGKSLWPQMDMIIQSKSEGRKSGTSSPTLCPSC